MTLREAEQTEFDVFIDDISERCFEGEPVPRALRALWREQFDRGKSLLRDAAYGEVTLVERPAEEHPELQAFYFSNDKWGRGYRRMFEEITLFGEGADGHFYGLWRYDDEDRLGDAPVVRLDNEGQWRVMGPDIEGFILRSASWSDETEVARARRWLERRGLGPCEQLDEIEEECESLPDPDESYLDYVERLPASSSNR